MIDFFYFFLWFTIWNYLVKLILAPVLGVRTADWIWWSTEHTLPYIAYSSICKLSLDCFFVCPGKKWTVPNIFYQFCDIYTVFQKYLKCMHYSRHIIASNFQEGLNVGKHFVCSSPERVLIKLVWNEAKGGTDFIYKYLLIKWKPDHARYVLDIRVLILLLNK